MYCFWHETVTAKLLGAASMAATAKAARKERVAKRIPDYK